MDILERVYYSVYCYLAEVVCDLLNHLKSWKDEKK